MHNFLALITVGLLISLLELRLQVLLSAFSPGGELRNLGLSFIIDGRCEMHF